MTITKKQQSLLDDYDIYGYHSGGGCMHFAYDTEHNELQWLINPVDLLDDSKGKSYYEPNPTYPSNKDQLCMFGLHYEYLGFGLGKKVKETLSNYASFPNCNFYEGGFYFHDTLENGVPKMKKVTESINKLIKDQD